jgi:hypothetical protein
MIKKKVLTKRRKQLTQKKTQRHIPEPLNPQQHRCENLKTRNIVTVFSSP